MELVRGIKITDYCEQNHLPTRDRLSLFIKVCQAIQHAHQKGIIHRDLKPSNILVTLHDGVPVPKVIDFGIAKATEGRLADLTVYTELRQFIGTPAYMSPEQAEMSGLDIDTRSDIYSLGVLLYELLTGKTPFDAKELLAAGLDEMRRTIRDKVPVKPSTRLTQALVAGDGVGRVTPCAPPAGDSIPIGSAHGVTRPTPKTEEEIRASLRRLLQELRGDLDWIVMKCLEKDRTRRYETANGLAHDIERHLQHEPVMARPPSTAYRAQKFVRRNKVMATAVGLVASALVLGIAVSAWQAVRASRLRTRAEANEQKAIAAQANEAKQQRLAQANELLARQNAYAADMKIVDTAWREHNLGQAMGALRRWIPKPGASDLRGIEWRYLWHKCQGQQLTTFRHEAEVTGADLSPDGRWLATQSGGAFWIWDTAREGERRVLSSSASRDTFLGVGEHLAFDPQGRFLATATTSNVLIWDTSNWLQQQSLPATDPSPCFSGDGATLAIYSREGVQVWKTATWDSVVRLGEIKPTSAGAFRPFEGNCRGLALNRDGSLLAVSWQNIWKRETEPMGEVALWKIPQCQPLSLAGEVNDAVRLAFSDDGHWLAAGTLGPPAMVHLWSVPERKLVAQWRASEGLGRTLAFGPGGRALATAGTDQVIRLWETDQTNLPPRLLEGHLDDVFSLRFAADGRLVSASNDGTVRLWNINQLRSSQPAFPLPPGRLICAQPADVHKLLTVNLTNLTFEEWDIDSGQCVRQTSIEGADTILHHGALSNGRPLTDGLLSRCYVIDVDVLPGVGRLRQLISILDSGSPAWDLCACSGDGRVYFWNATSGELVYSNKLAATLLGAAPIANHKKLIFQEDWGGPVSSYDLQTHQTELLEEHVPSYTPALKSSPDGRLFAYVTTGGQVKVWDTTTKQTKSVIKLSERGYTFCVEFSPDSRILAVATFSGWVRMFDADTGQPMSDPLAGYAAHNWKVNFSADGKSLITYCADNTAKIWNVATGREMVSGLPLNHLITDQVAWRLLPPDGNSLVEGEGEGAIRVVHLPTLPEIDALETRQTNKD